MDEYAIPQAMTTSEVEQGVWAVSELEWEYAQYFWEWPVSGDNITRWRAENG